MASKIALLVIAATLTVAMTGCAKEKGPMEKMGEGLDEAAQSIEKSAEEAAENVQEAVEQ
ncbi:MAG: hypothetical protein KA137_06550 [Halioglobus sp.]|nr:hypothetical protein [Halioglobus sp.]